MSGPTCPEWTTKSKQILNEIVKQLAENDKIIYAVIENYVKPASYAGIENDDKPAMLGLRMITN